MKLARGIGKKSVGIYPLAFAAIAAGTSYALGSDLHHSAKLSIGSKISYEIACAGALWFGIKIITLSEADDKKFERKGKKHEAIHMIMNTGGSALVVFGAVSALTIPFQ